MLPEPLPKHNNIRVKSTTMSVPEAHKYTENRTLPIRFGTRGPLSYFEQAETLSRTLLASLPFDMLLASVVVPVRFPPHLLAFMTTAAAALLCLSTIFFLREQLIDGFERLRSYQHRISSSGLKHSKFAIAALILLIILETSIRLGKFGLIALMAGAFVAYRAYQSLRETFSAQRARLEQIERDRTLLLDTMNRQIFLFSVIPVGCARMASLLAALTAFATTHDLLWWAPFGAASLVLMLSHYPQQEHFLIQCKRCSRWTSRALKSYGYCPVCSREEFQVKDTGAQSVPKERSQERTLPVKTSKKGAEPSGPAGSTTKPRSRSYDIAKGLAGKFFPRTKRG